MKKIYKISLILLAITLCIGCGVKEKDISTSRREKTVIKDKHLEGLEFANVSAENNVIKSVVINNTGYLYEGSKFKMVLLDANSEVIDEIIDEVKEEVENGTTLDIETKVNIDLNKVAAIEYSIVK